jgi:hypothetical protein
VFGNLGYRACACRDHTLCCIMDVEEAVPVPDTDPMEEDSK